ncbi:MAG: AMP-binding protein [Desulfobacterales bacterium]|nr:AMP-binding protein [Desulfobacterales bacterium]
MVHQDVPPTPCSWATRARGAIPLRRGDDPDAHGRTVVGEELRGAEGGIRDVPRAPRRRGEGALSEASEEHDGRPALRSGDQGSLRVHLRELPAGAVRRRGADEPPARGWDRRLHGDPLDRRLSRTQVRHRRQGYGDGRRQLRDHRGDSRVRPAFGRIARRTARDGNRREHDGVTMFCFTFPDLLTKNVTERPEHPALVYGDDTMTYGRLDAAVERFAGNLADLGIRKGDRVCIHCASPSKKWSPPFAVSRIGGVFVDINHQLTLRQLKYALENAQVRVLITDRLKALALARDGVPDELEHVIIHGGAAGGCAVCCPGGPAGRSQAALRAAYRQRPVRDPVHVGLDGEAEGRHAFPTATWSRAPWRRRRTSRTCPRIARSASCR